MEIPYGSYINLIHLSANGYGGDYQPASELLEFGLNPLVRRRSNSLEARWPRTGAPGVSLFTLLETNIAPENGWLEYYSFLLGWPISRCYVSFGEGIPPGKDRWLATPISLGKNHRPGNPNRHLLKRLAHFLLSPDCKANKKNRMF